MTDAIEEKIDSVFEINCTIEEIEAFAAELFARNELKRFFERKLSFRKRTEEEQAELMRELNAKAYAMTFGQSGLGITVEKGRGYYACCSRHDADRIERILGKGVHPSRFKLLDAAMFVPDRITVDADDLENELPEVIHGSLRHEIGEVKYNNWKHFVIRQYHVEQKCIKGEMGAGWGKDYAYFINGVGDPRINHLVSLDSEEARKDIIYSEIDGIIGMLDFISDIPRHHQFLMLANCRAAETFAPTLAAAVRELADPVAVHYYEKHKPLLQEITEAVEINVFYRLANRLWVDYTRHIVAGDQDRGIEQYRRLSEIWPVCNGMNMTLDSVNGVLIPLPGNTADFCDMAPHLTILNPQAYDSEGQPASEADREKLRELSNRLLGDRQENESRERQHGQRVSGDQEKKKNRTARPGSSAKRRNHGRRFKGGIEDLSNRFANNVNEFMPMQAAALRKRQSRGSLSIRSYIDTLGRATNIYNSAVQFTRYYAAFSVIVDTSGSMAAMVEDKRSKMAYTKDAAYAFCNGLAGKQIPFELITYGSSDSPQCGLEVIHAIDDLSRFSRLERSRFAAVTATGWQSDVWALESSAERLFPFAHDSSCTPFFLMLCDGCTGIELKHAVQKLKQNGAVVVGIGIKLNKSEKEEFHTNFGRDGIFVDDMRHLVSAMINKLKVERNRILLYA